ncbi:hypothetical protein MPDQ_001216 [Monascus purpureus]|uniref:Uncharacterized protein n=1 Tax=Monascus purpureus TaxID=5098 RepID=A0A507R324_MONPU|nr:hypothetical protein MPDQ_001216 [Monascus purpureus]
MAKIEGMGQRSWICEYQRPCVQVPHGPWPKDPKLKELGAWNQLQAMEGLEGWTMAPFCRVLGWSLEEVQVHLAGAQKDYCDPNIHAYIPLYLMYGQKPNPEDKGEEGEKETSTE